jgi:hypothetical protein
LFTDISLGNEESKIFPVSLISTKSRRYNRSTFLPFAFIVNRWPGRKKIFNASFYVSDACYVPTVLSSCADACLASHFNVFFPLLMIALFVMLMLADCNTCHVDARLLLC